MTDLAFHGGIRHEAKDWLNSNVETYLYQFNYDSPTLPYTGKFVAAFHAMDLFYLFPVRQSFLARMQSEIG